jgi:hypothetical protein
MALVNQRHQWPVAIAMTWPFSSSASSTAALASPSEYGSPRHGRWPDGDARGVKAHIEMLAGIRRHFESA